MCWAGLSSPHPHSDSSGSDKGHLTVVAVRVPREVNSVVWYLARNCTREEDSSVPGDKRHLNLGLERGKLGEVVASSIHLQSQEMVQTLEVMMAIFPGLRLGE